MAAPKAVIAAAGKDLFAKQRGATGVVVSGGPYDGKVIWLAKSGLIDEEAKVVLVAPDDMFSMDEQDTQFLVPYLSGQIGNTGLNEVGSFNDAFVIAYTLGRHDNEGLVLLRFDDHYKNPKF